MKDRKAYTGIDDFRFAVRKWGLKKVLVITSVLYIVGLFGDSYYGIASEIPFLKNLYAEIFDILDYTRNGVFFAPVFFVLGGAAAEMSAAENRVYIEERRKDTKLSFLRGGRRVLLRSASLVIYIIHPMLIVVIRLIAKLTGLQSILIENSLVHYFMVSAASIFFAVFSVKLWDRWKNRGSTDYVPGTDRAWLEIDMHSLGHNVEILKNEMPADCKLMAVMKAEAYGHGMYETASYLNQIGVDAFAAATIDEGICLRRCGIVGEILILGYTDPARAGELHKYDLIQTLIDYPYSRLLNKQGYDIKAHMKIDTGMHRLGFGKEEIEKIVHVFKMRHIQVCGIYTHLCVADSRKEKDIRFTKIQINSFYRVLEELRKKGVTVPKIHMQSSYGLLNYPQLRCDYVRAGIALYGVPSSPKDKTKLPMELWPVLSLKSRVVLIRKIKKGESVGYGRTFVAQRDSMIAVLPVGYADGLPRNLSCGRGRALIHGQMVPVIGRICMDQLTIDVTDIENVSVGEVATLIGRDGEKELPASEAAGRAGSITNELLSRMGGRLSRILVW